MNFNKIILCFVFLFLIGIVSASAPTLGVFKQNSVVELKQTCVINGTFCDSCNISSVDYPNGTIIISDVGMTKRNGDFNFTLNSTNTNLIGQYRVNGFCDFGADVRKTWVYYFDVTFNGIRNTTSQSIIYIITFLGLLFLFSILIFSFFNIPTEARRDDEGFMMGINYWKYVKWGLGLFSYFTLIWIVNILVLITNNFLPLGTATIFFRMIYFFLITALLPLAPIVFYIFIFNVVRDREIRQALERGIRIR